MSFVSTLYGDAKYEVFAAFAIDVVNDTSFVYNQYVDMDENTYNAYVPMRSFPAAMWTAASAPATASSC